MSGAQFRHFDVGDIRVTTVADGFRQFPLPEGLVLNASTDEINAALVAAGLQAGQLTIHFNPVVISTGKHCALVDTGNGIAAGQAAGSTVGQMLASQEAAGIPLESIDTVIISHFHGDHMAGLVTPEGRSAFPNARILVPEPEWAFWMDDAKMEAAGPLAQNFEACRKIFGAVASQVSQYRWGEEVIPGVKAVGTPGHTPGHTSFMVESDGHRLFIFSDVTNNPALFVTHPGWQLRFDQDPNQAEATRRKTLEMLADGKIVVQGFHFPFPGRAFIEKDGDGYRTLPSD